MCKVCSHVIACLSMPSAGLRSGRYGQDVGLEERIVEVVRQHTEKIYGVLRDGETVTGRSIVPVEAGDGAGTDDVHQAGIPAGVAHHLKAPMSKPPSWNTFRERYFATAISVSFPEKPTFPTLTR